MALDNLLSLVVNSFNKKHGGARVGHEPEMKTHHIFLWTQLPEIPTVKALGPIVQALEMGFEGVPDISIEYEPTKTGTINTINTPKIMSKSSDSFKLSTVEYVGHPNFIFLKEWMFAIARLKDGLRSAASTPDLKAQGIYFLIHASTRVSFIARFDGIMPMTLPLGQFGHKIGDNAQIAFDLEFKYDNFDFAIGEEDPIWYLADQFMPTIQGYINRTA
jgi:hypothetical protein